MKTYKVSFNVTGKSMSLPNSFERPEIVQAQSHEEAYGIAKGWATQSSRANGIQIFVTTIE